MGQMLHGVCGNLKVRYEWLEQTLSATLTDLRTVVLVCLKETLSLAQIMNGIQKHGVLVMLMIMVILIHNIIQAGEISLHLVHKHFVINVENLEGVCVRHSDGEQISRGVIHSS